MQLSEITLVILVEFCISKPCFSCMLSLPVLFVLKVETQVTRDTCLFKLYILLPLVITPAGWSCPSDTDVTYIFFYSRNRNNASVLSHLVQLRARILHKKQFLNLCLLWLCNTRIVRT